MKLPGHMAGGWLITRGMTRWWKLSKSERQEFLAFGAIAGSLPDWDYLWYIYRKGRIDYSRDFRHHTWITHTFLFYWILAALVYALGLFRNDTRLKRQAAIVVASTTVHLLQDTIGSGDGIMLFYPFSKRMDGIALSGLHGREWEAHYTASPIYLVEVFTVLLAGLSFLVDALSDKTPQIKGGPTRHAADWRCAPSQRAFVASESLLQATHPSEVRASG